MEFADQHLRRLAGGTCLILGPGLTLAGWSIHPSMDAATDPLVADVAAAPTRAATSTALVVVGATLTIFAFLALVHLLRERQPVLGDIGGALAIFGMAMFAAVMGNVLTEIAVIRELGGATATATLIDAIDNSASLAVVFVGALLANVGAIVLSIGLYRARVTPWPLAALLGVGTVVQGVGLYAITSILWGIVGSALMFIGLAGIGIQLIMETDEAWEHAPEFDGFHSVAPG